MKILMLKFILEYLAANYAADKLGAPLNDYANISLSNILTPLSEIEKKLEFALKANLVIAAIYNPIVKHVKNLLEGL